MGILHPVKVVQNNFVLLIGQQFRVKSETESHGIHGRRTFKQSTPGLEKAFP